MGWSIGFDTHWNRDIGYGVPCTCDHPDCNKLIDRGLSYVCGGEPYGGSNGCGLYFCAEHLYYAPVLDEGEEETDDSEYRQCCDSCRDNLQFYKPKPDLPVWIRHKLTDPSWAEWRAENPKYLKKHDTLVTAIIRRWQATFKNKKGVYC